MPTLTSLAEAILERAKKIDAGLEARNIQPPSFEGEDTLDQLPDDLQEERWALADAANELKLLSRGAAAGVEDIAVSWTDILALRVVYHYKLANAVPLEGTTTYAEIAAASGLNEDLARRFMRLAMGSRIFTEDAKTHLVSHTAASRQLAKDSGLQDLVGLELEDIAPASSKLVDVWKTYGQDAAEPSQTAFSLYNDPDKPIFQILAEHPHRAARFGNAMKYFMRGDRWDLRHLLTSFDWAAIDQPGVKAVDIGGGNGQISQYLARNTSNIYFTVQDLPHVTAAAPAQLPEDLKSRVGFATHDFFQPQVAESSPDIFLLRFILHNWADSYAVKILKNLVPAMRKDSKVLIYEYVLDDFPVVDYTGRFQFQMDGIMATLFNAKERSAAQYKTLLAEADKRFTVVAVSRPANSTMSVVEVGWIG